MATSPLVEAVEAASPAAAITALYGPDVAIAASHAVGGGCINRTARLVLSNGAAVFLKENDGRLPDLFRREAEGLQALAAAPGAPRVPRPLAVGVGAGRPFLLLEWIAPGAPGPRCYADLGRALAALHRTTAPAFGFAHDNYIGATPQPNRWERDFVRFFGEARLHFQVARAARAGRADGALVRAVERVIARLPDLLAPVPTRPALLHGDLWGGNVYVAADGAAAILDPAAYFGAPEADLAMTELFGALPPAFYDAYREAAPLAPGYATRREIYNLYHLLNHLNLFGPGYAAAALRVAQRFA